MSKLTGKVAVITGASQGIGAEVAKSLAAAGASVVVNYVKNKQGAEAVQDAIARAGGNAITFGGDVSLAENAQGLIECAVKEWGRLDILVNNAGVYEFAPLEAVTVESFEKVFRLNVLAVLLTTQAAARHLGEGGSVVNIGSNITTMLMPTSSVYAGSKAAVEAITRVLSKELGPKKIRVNCVVPGPVDTETSRSMSSGMEDQLKAIVGMTPLGRLGEPSDVASVVTFLASDHAAWVTGAVILNSGGL